MKLTSVFLLALALQVSAHSGAQSVTYTAKETPFVTVLSAMEQQTGYVFFYKKQDIQHVQPVTASFKNMSLQKVLSEILKGQPLSFNIQGKTVFINRKEIPLYQAPPAIAAKIWVANDKGELLQGASVLVKNTGKLFFTNAQGTVSVQLNKGDILEISFVGHEKQTETADGVSENIYISLKTSSSRLDEIMVKAYGTTTRRLNTGNIAKVSSEQIEQQPVTNPLAALEGRVPGMVITQGNGLPGSQFGVRIQGRTAIDKTITDDQPLFIINGIPMPTNNGPVNRQLSSLGTPELNGQTERNLLMGMSPFSSIDPGTIESIEVLKGADATAIYGSRGANGVVLITTKNGKAGNTRLEANISTGFSKVAKRPELMSTTDYIAMRKAAYQNDGMTPDDWSGYDIKTWDNTRYTDISKLLYGNTAALTNARLTLSGGSDYIQYLISGNYRYQGTVMPGNSNDKTSSLHFNISNQSAGNKFKAVFSGSYANEQNNLLSLPSNNLFVAPNIRIYDDNGKLAWNEGGIITQDYYAPNPIAFLNNLYLLNVKNLTSSLLLSYKILPNLSLRTSMGYSAIHSKENGRNPASAVNPSSAIQRRSEFNNNQFISHIIEPQLEYTGRVKKYTVNILTGGSYQANNTEGTNIIAQGYTSDEQLSSLSGYSASIARLFKTQYRYEAVFAQINNNYNNKYILNIAARRDGSSRFGPGKQFSNFGSAGAAWIFSEEKQVKDNLTWLSFGKLRTSYGITGNDKIKDYQYLDTWTTPALGNYANNPTLYPAKLFNPNYHWERSGKWELAMELGLFNNNVLINATWYSNMSTSPLVQYQLPATTGFSSVVANLPAKVANRGLELSINTTNLQNQHFKWSSNLNLTIPRNELVSFTNLDQSSYANTYVTGQPLDVIYKYRYTGIDPQTGLSVLEDKNKDGLLTTADFQVAGSTSPRLFGGIGNSIKYKQLQIDFLFTYYRQQGFSYLKDISAPGSMSNLPAAMTGFWSGPGDDNASFQKLTQTYGDAYYSWSSMITDSDRPFEDASFVRLKNLSVSYSLNNKWLNKHKISGARLYLHGQNLLTFTPYTAGDPEIQSISSIGPLKTIVLGFQLSL